MSDRLRLAWLLEQTGISATARLAMAQADAMVDRGHDVRVVTSGEPVTWRSSRAEWVYVDELRKFEPAIDEQTVTGALPMIIVDEEFYRDGVRTEHDPPRVLLAGAWHDETAGIEEGYGAAAHARWFHQKLDLIRVSPWAPSREEPVENVHEFHVALTTAEMTRLTHSCDIFLGPSRRDERFGLPAAEAMASGIPCVLTAIPAFLSFDDGRDHALFAPDQNAVELGEKLIAMLSDAGLRERIRTRGRDVAEQWRAGHVAERLESFFRSHSTPR